MNFRAEIFKWVNCRRSSDVRQIVIVNLKLWSDQYPNADIEFAVIVQERALYRFLDDPLLYKRYHDDATGLEIKKLWISFQLLERMIPLPWLSDSGLMNQMFFSRCFYGIFYLANCFFSISSNFSLKSLSYVVSLWAWTLSFNREKGTWKMSGRLQKCVCLRELLHGCRNIWEFGWGRT